MTTQKSVDYSGMKQWMTPAMYESYCEDVKGELGIAHCKPGDVRKCGYNDNCNPAYQDCIQKSAREFQCVTRITKTYMETKLKDTIKPIEGDMKAKDVLKMIEESEIGSLHGVEVYIIVMASSYGEMGVAGDNAVMVTYESFRVALAWANTEDVGEDAKLQSDTEKQRDKLCPEDATGSSSLNSIIANIKLLGHNVKFFVLAREPSGRHDENIAISTMRPDTFIDGRCDRSAKSVKVMTGPGAGGIPG
eukprot:gene5580-9590_t